MSKRTQKLVRLKVRASKYTDDEIRVIATSLTTALTAITLAIHEKHNLPLATASEAIRMEIDEQLNEYKLEEQGE